MDIETYLKELPDKCAREHFAKKAGTTMGYLDHLKKGRKKPAGIDVLVRLIAASEGRLTLRDLRPDLFTGSGGKKSLAHIHEASRAGAK